MSYYPVLDQKGEVIQLGLLTFDISERKRLENALQKVTKKISLLNTVIFSDIQNKVFVQMGYLELARQTTQDPQLENLSGEGRRGGAGDTVLPPVRETVQRHGCQPAPLAECP